MSQAFIKMTKILRNELLRESRELNKRARLRKRCKPHGTVVFLLESLFLQAAALNPDSEIMQWNQPKVAIWGAPSQHLKSMIQQLCARNRTKDGENAREETQMLDEIDMDATESLPKQMKAEDRIKLDIVRTGLTWTRTAAYWAGHV